MSDDAIRYRQYRLCPFNNKVPNCTKDKANNPLGVCSIYHRDDIVVTCPIRFRQDWVIAEDAAGFFFGPQATWTSLAEVRLTDKQNNSAGNIDIVLVSYDDRGRVIDFGALEVQGVYISGNVRRPFEHYMSDPSGNTRMDWTNESNYPRPDYLSSSRKRLAPQLLCKGGIINDWQRKIAVAVNRGFFNTLPVFEEVTEADADIAWLVYDLIYDQEHNKFKMNRYKTVYSKFKLALDKITRPEPGDQQNFIDHIQAKLDEVLDNGNPPDAPTLDVLL